MDLETINMFVSWDVIFDENTSPFSCIKYPLPTPASSLPTIPLAPDWSAITCESRKESGGVPNSVPSIEPSLSQLEHSRPTICTRTVQHTPLISHEQVQDPATGQNVLEPPSAIIEQPLGWGLRSHNPPTHLRDYVYHTTQVLHLISSPRSTWSLDTCFSLANYHMS